MLRLLAADTNSTERQSEGQDRQVLQGHKRYDLRG